MDTRNRKRLRDYLITEEGAFDVENGETSISQDIGILKSYFRIYQNTKNKI